eukprot:4274141-Amphidinium_carterae.1
MLPLAGVEASAGGGDAAKTCGSNIPCRAGGMGTTAGHLSHLAVSADCRKRCSLLLGFSALLES